MHTPGITRKSKEKSTLKTLEHCFQTASERMLSDFLLFVHKTDMMPVFLSTPCHVVSITLPRVMSQQESCLRI